jgi:hypothetical protein
MKPRRSFPHTRVAQLNALKADGDLKVFYDFVTQRIREYRIQLDEKGAIGHDGEAMTLNHVVCMLKRDCRNECPPVSNGILDHIVRHALKVLIERGMAQLEAMDHG